MEYVYLAILVLAVISICFTGFIACTCYTKTYGRVNAPIKNDEDCCAHICATCVAAGNDTRPSFRQGEIQP